MRNLAGTAWVAELFMAGSRMRTMPVTALALLLALAVTARAAEQKTAPRAETEKTAGAENPFTPPPGWQKKKRGKFIVYCRKQSQMSTRVPAEVCYDEEGIRAMLAAQRDDRERVDQMRRICSSQATCGAN